MKSRNRSTAFTLLELVVVLAILSIVTVLAMRSIGGIEDQRRFETNQRELQDLSDAVVGSSDDRATDGSRTISGFVADMGRLPQTVASGSIVLDGQPALTLDELATAGTNPAFDVRFATTANGVSSNDADGQVLVPGGWRGPYLRLPLGAVTLLDGWGNPFTSSQSSSPSNPTTTGYARLRDASDNAITTVGQAICKVHTLGANGTVGTTDTGYDQDEVISFLDQTNPSQIVDRYHASLAGHVEVIDTTTSPPQPASIASLAGQSVTIRVFGPDPTNPAHILVVAATFTFASTDPVTGNSVTNNPVTWAIPMTQGMTIGPRIVRAYLNPAGTSTPASGTIPKSPVKSVTLRAGTNILDLTIYE